MATLSHIPSPASVSVKTAGYTIPLGRYARAIVNLEGSATFTIDGVTALRGTQNSVLGSDNLRLATTGTTPSSGALFTATSDTAVTAVGTAFTEATDQKTVVQDVFLPPGAVINGTGTFRVIVEEYLGA